MGEVNKLQQRIELLESRFRHFHQSDHGDSYFGNCKQCLLELTDPIHVQAALAKALGKKVT